MENVNSLIIEHLRAIRADIGTVKEDVREVRTHLAHIENGIAGLKHDSAHQYDETAAANVKFDRITERIEKIERRLELQQ